MLHVPILVIGGLVGSGAAALKRKSEKKSLKASEKKQISTVSENGNETMLVVAEANTGSGQIDDEKEGVDHYLKVSSVSLLFAAAGTFLYSPLLVPAVGMVVYSSYPVFR